MSAAVVTLGVAVVLLGMLVAAALHRQAALSRAVAELSEATRPSGPPPAPRRSLVGLPATAICGPDPSGEAVEHRWGPDGTATVLAFLTGSCTTCQPFWAALTGAGPSTPAGLPVIVVTPSPTTESRRTIAARAGEGLDVVMSSDAWTAYGARGAPWFAVVEAGMVRAEGPAASWQELVALATP